MFNNKFAVVYHANRGKELIRSSAEWNKIAKGDWGFANNSKQYTVICHDDVQTVTRAFFQF